MCGGVSPWLILPTELWPHRILTGQAHKFIDMFGHCLAPGEAGKVKEERGGKGGRSTLKVTFGCVPDDVRSKLPPKCKAPYLDNAGIPVLINDIIVYTAKLQV